MFERYVPLCLECKRKHNLTMLGYDVILPENQQCRLCGWLTWGAVATRQRDFRVLSKMAALGLLIPEEKPS